MDRGRNCATDDSGSESSDSTIIPIPCYLLHTHFTTGEGLAKAVKLGHRACIDNYTLLDIRSKILWEFL